MEKQDNTTLNAKVDLNSQQSSSDRDKIIVKTSIIGILANVLLAAFKATVGLLSHSIAIVLDAVNNISDAASSIITIVGTKLAGKEPDRKHPFGHGRVEYLSAMIISVIVLYAGGTSLLESIKKIIKPEEPEYKFVTLLIISVAVVVKIVLGLFVKRTGEKTNSDSLINSGKDALLDSIISASTLVAAIIFMTTHLSLEAYLGAIISIVIIKSGIEMLKETISELLGERADFSLAIAIKKTVREFPGVSGAYDLVLNNYGPNTFNGSIHIEVPDTMQANELDTLMREITVAVYEKFNVYLTGISIYSVNTKDPHAIEMRETISAAVLKHDHVLQVHGFYLNEQTKSIRFDMVVSFSAKSRRAVYEGVLSDLEAQYPGYNFRISTDFDFSET